ncbi:MAG: hypothetical protein ACOCN0_01645 [Prevotella sp.]
MEAKEQYGLEIRKLRRRKVFAQVMIVIGFVFFALLLFICSSIYIDHITSEYHGDGTVVVGVVSFFAGIWSLIILQGMSIPMLIWRNADIKEDWMRMNGFEDNEGNSEAGLNEKPSVWRKIFKIDKYLSYFNILVCLVGVVIWGIVCIEDGLFAGLLAGVIPAAICIFLSWSVIKKEKESKKVKELLVSMKNSKTEVSEKEAGNSVLQCD